MFDGKKIVGGGMAVIRRVLNVLLWLAALNFYSSNASGAERRGFAAVERNALVFSPIGVAVPSTVSKSGLACSSASPLTEKIREDLIKANALFLLPLPPPADPVAAEAKLDAARYCKTGYLALGDGLYLVHHPGLGVLDLKGHRFSPLLFGGGEPGTFKGPFRVGSNVVLWLYSKGDGPGYMYSKTYWLLIFRREGDGDSGVQYVALDSGGRGTRKKNLPVCDFGADVNPLFKPRVTTTVFPPQITVERGRRAVIRFRGWSEECPTKTLSMTKAVFLYEDGEVIDQGGNFLDITDVRNGSTATPF